MVFHDTFGNSLAHSHLPRFGTAVLPSLLLALTSILGSNPALAEENAIPPLRCNQATLKGTCLCSPIGVLDGKPDAETDCKYYDGEGGVALTFSGIGGAAGTLQARCSVSPDCTGKTLSPYAQSLGSCISPDGSHFSTTIACGPGDRLTALSGWEIRVAP